MKKVKQPRLWVWAVLVRSSDDTPWRVEVAMESNPQGSMGWYSARNSYGSRNVRVRRVEVKP